MVPLTHTQKFFTSLELPGTIPNSKQVPIFTFPASTSRTLALLQRKFWNSAGWVHCKSTLARPNPYCSTQLPSWTPSLSPYLHCAHHHRPPNTTLLKHSVRLCRGFWPYQTQDPSTSLFLPHIPLFLSQSPSSLSRVMLTARKLNYIPFYSLQSLVPQITSLFHTHQPTPPGLFLLR